MEVLIFGGAGFIGSALTKKLLAKGHNVCVICRDMSKAEKNIGKHPNLSLRSINILNEAQLKTTIKEYECIINLIGKLYETKPGEFEKFHYDFVQKLINAIQNEQHLIHISALGVEDSRNSSLYAKTKYNAEQAIIKNTEKYNIIKPSIVFGRQDNFFNMFAKMSSFSPIIPLIGGGKTKFSPVYVQDLVDAICVLIEQKNLNKVYAACGPDTETFKHLMQYILKILGRKRLLIAIPYSIARLQAQAMNVVNIYILTTDQVELLKHDNINNNNLANINDLIKKLTSYKDIVPSYLKKTNKKA